MEQCTELELKYSCPGCQDNNRTKSCFVEIGEIFPRCPLCSHPSVVNYERGCMQFSCEIAGERRLFCTIAGACEKCNRILISRGPASLSMRFNKDPHPGLGLLEWRFYPPVGNRCVDGARRNWMNSSLFVIDTEQQRT